MKFLSSLILIATLVASGSTVSLAGEAYYRWTDKWDNPVHSDRPPPKGVEYEIVSSSTSLVRRVNLAEDVAPPEVEAKETEPSTKNKFKQADTETTKYVVEKNSVFCELAKSNLNSLNTRAQIRIKNEKGEYHILTEEEKETKRSESTDQIEAYCE